MKTRSVSMNLRVSDLLNEKQIGGAFLPEGKFTVILDYPLGAEHHFVVQSKFGMTAYDVAVRIAREYKKIYNEPERYGVRYHNIEDLAIEGMRVDLENSVVRVDIGS